MTFSSATFGSTARWALAAALVVAAWSPVAPAQDRLSERIGSIATLEPGEHDPIRADELLADIAYLASDELGGRNTGTEGERLAAAHIIARLTALPLVEAAGEEGFFQVFPAMRMSPRGPAPNPGRNVIAFLPGSDPALAHEVIVLGAHYDHVGHGEFGNSLVADEIGGDLSNRIDTIHNGADDNASGSSALLELAASLATSPDRPRRSIMFHWYSGEELGLLGSRYWVGNPTVPFEDVVAMINLDMVGRLVGSTVYAGGIGTSPSFAGFAREAAADEGLSLIEDLPGAAPSDNASFHAADIPVLFFFTGLHTHYHTPDDEVDKINAEGAARIARTVEAIVRSIDGMAKRPPFVRASGEPKMFRPRVYTGLNFVDAEPWMLGCAIVSIIIPESPGHRAGVLEGDVVFRVDGERLKDRAALEALLSVTDPERSAREYDLWRPLPGVRADEDGEWLEMYERLTIEVRPAVR